MSLQYSYALYEKDFSHEFREKLNRSEDGSDISNHFSHTITKMFNKIFGDKFKTKDPDIIFEPGNGPHFSFSRNLLDNVEFQNALENSNIGNIVERFAESAHHRYVHLAKHSEKTNSKIRHKI